MKYIKVFWKHPFTDEPVLLYSELDELRFEKRKVEHFADGTVSFADEAHSSDSPHCMLGLEPVPSLREIADEAEFEPHEIDEEEFMEIWAVATKRGVR